jgi:hypothetical protein
MITALATAATRKLSLISHEYGCVLETEAISEVSFLSDFSFFKP